MEGNRQSNACIPGMQAKKIFLNVSVIVQKTDALVYRKRKTHK